MTLEEKGPVKPPPVLSKFPQQVSREIQSWKDIIAATHWYLYDPTQTDGADFYVGHEQLGHIHLDGEIHLATGKQLAAALIKNKLAGKFPYGSDWVMSPINSAKHVAHAIWHFKLNYNRIKGAPVEQLLKQINIYNGINN